MSSHHFVKEKQEPALLIIQTGSCDFRIIEELLEWSPQVFVKANLIEEILLWGIKVDFVFGVKSHIEKAQKLLENQQSVTFLEKENHKDIFGYISKIGQKTVSILDNFQVIGQNPELEKIYYFENKKYFQINSKVWKKWTTENTQYQIFAQDFQTQNLAQINQENFRVEKDGFIKIESQSETFWIGESIL